MSAVKFAREPRAHGPDYLARWGHHGGYWRLVVLGRNWEVVDLAFTDVPAHEPRPDDPQWLRKVRFAPAADDGWERDGECWQRGVVPLA